MASYRSENRNIAFNVSQIERALKDAQGKVDLLCFGEAFLQGFDSMCWKYETDQDVQEDYYNQLIDMVHELKEITPNFGIFITIYPGVEALLPAAEISDEHINLNAKYNIGDEIKAQIKKFTPEEHRIGLSVKGLTE